MRHFLISFFFVVFAMLPNELFAGNKTVSFSSDKIKAALILKLSQFIEIPNSKAKDVCIVQSDYIGLHMSGMQSNFGFDANIVKKSMSSDFDSCKIIVIGNLKQSKVEQFLSSKTSVQLTIGETEGFVDAGGIIGFVFVNNKIKFEVNFNSAKSKNIKIESDLLQIAHRVLHDK